MPAYPRSEMSETPWNDWLEWLISQPGGDRIFRSSQESTRGYIIACWADKNNRLPTHYLDEFHIWCQFGSQTESEDPKQYIQLKRALRTVRKMKEGVGHGRVGIAFWVHPQDHYEPEAIYADITGGKFPGCPTQ